jgi:hypothetical protein
MAETEPVEIGFLCRRGHFIFYDEPDVDTSCGSKRMAGIFVVPEEGVYPHYFADALADAREDFGEDLGRMYPPEPESWSREDREIFNKFESDEMARIRGEA